MKSCLFLTGTLLTASSALASTSQFSHFKPGAITPAGHVREFLTRQIDGTTGHRRDLGYPFDGCMWAGAIENVIFQEDLPYSRVIAAPRDGVWWPYEQAAYLLDGMVRLSQLVPAPEIRADFVRNLNACIDRAAPNGDLFASYSNSDSRWPMVVFFRAALAYYEETGDARVREAFIRHYAALRSASEGTDDRDVLNVEGMLKVAEWTGDRSYVDAAEAWFKKHIYFDFFAHRERVHSHGVTFAEMMKLPALLYRATGKEEWKALALKAMNDVYRMNESPAGIVSACEYLSGRDPWEGTETCVTADLMCSLGYFVEIFGDCAAADRMERIAYNALPGAMTKDFTRHQYISLPNQVVATPFSHGSHFFYGEPDWNRFRACHFAQCCTGNINRAMPLFAACAYLKDESGAPVAMLLGPLGVKGVCRGVSYAIACETDYPFGDTLRYRFTSDRPVAMPFTFRVPSWATGATVTKNGAALDLAVTPGTLARIAGETWKSGDTLEVTFDQPVKVHHERHWHWLTRGALTFAYPVKTTRIDERPGERFCDISFENPAPFNYAFDLDELAAAKLTVEKRVSAYPFETPNLVLRVPVREIEEWRTLDEQRFTPHVPLYTHPTGRKASLEFVPYATTLTRITAFPDTVRRVALPVVRTYASPQCYDYDPKRPLAEQMAEPETWSDETFCDKAEACVIQRAPDLWSDLESHYLFQKGKFAYVLIRFWSDREGPVTCALGATRCVQAFFEGREVYANGPIVEGRLVAPFWFGLTAKKGYNYLKVKVATNGKEKVFGQDQYRREWGVKLEVFRNESTSVRK